MHQNDEFWRFVSFFNNLVKSSDHHGSLISTKRSPDLSSAKAWGKARTRSWRRCAAGIAAGQPDHLRWGTETLKQVHEIAVLGEHGGFRFSGGLEYLLVRRVAHPQLAHRRGRDVEGLRDPGSERR